MNIDDLATKAPDYSTEFTARVEQLKTILEPVLGHCLRHQTAMDYAAGQALEFEAPPNDRLQLWISSRGPVWTYTLLTRMGKNEWKATHERARSPEIAARIDAASRRLSDLGIELVAPELHQQMLPGYETELDGAPANVFQRLFSEIL